MHYRTEIFEASVSMDEFTERFVDVKKFLGYCRECANYGKSFSCPPYDFQPEALWRKYREVKVVGMKILFDEDVVGTTLSSEEWLKLYTDILRKEENHLYRILKEEETAAEGRYLLNPGRCRICGKQDCDRREGECDHPELRRYSIESLGGNVAAVASELLQFDLQWIEEGKIPPYLCLVGGMLYR